MSQRMPVPAAALAAAGLLLVLPACKSRWHKQSTHDERVITNLIVRSSPPDAMVSLNGVDQATAPVRIPIEYAHSEEHYARQMSYGRLWLEEWSVPFKILGAPIWILALPLHHRQELRRHVYGHNLHVVSVRARGYVERVRELKLEGQDDVEFTMELEPRAK